MTPSFLCFRSFLIHARHENGVNQMLNVDVKKFSFFHFRKKAATKLYVLGRVKKKKHEMSIMLFSHYLILPY